MTRWDGSTFSSLSHLSVEGSCGGTTLGLHLAADVIQKNGRVLWACQDMPNAERFRQLFEHLSLVESSKFHAMNFGGNFERAIQALIEARRQLPRVALIVLDDWAPPQGRIPPSNFKGLEKLVEACIGEVRVLLLSKGGTDVTQSSNLPVTTRGQSELEMIGFECFTLSKGQRSGSRILHFKDHTQQLMIEDSGFVI